MKTLVRALPLLSLVILLTACSLGAQPAATDTAVPPTSAPLPTVAPIENPTAAPTIAPTIEPTISNLVQVSFNGVTFSYDPSWVTSIQGEIEPAVTSTEGGSPVMDGVHPENVLFTITGYPLSGTFHDPAIRVYPLADFAALDEIFANELADLTALLASQPASVARDQSIPFMPMWNAAQVFHSNMAYINTPNLTGVRYLTLYAQYAAPLNNQDLFYTFQGITKDGKYFISAILPMSQADLPADGTNPPGGDWNAFAENYQDYLTGAVDQLEQSPLTSFNPLLAHLDVMFETMSVQ